jgi:hypothetical protein
MSFFTACCAAAGTAGAAAVVTNITETKIMITRNACTQPPAREVPAKPGLQMAATGSNSALKAWTFESVCAFMLPVRDDVCTMTFVMMLLIVFAMMFVMLSMQTSSRVPSKR